MKTQAAVVADDPVYLNWLQNAAPNAEFVAIRPLDGPDLLERLQVLEHVDMVFFQIESATLKARLAMMELLVDRMPEVPLAGIGAENNPELVLACMRAGARDYFVLRRDEATVASSLNRLLKRSTQTQKPGRGGVKAKLFTLLGAHPSEAVAFNAEHLAISLARPMASGERLLLLDAAMPAGAAAIFMNVAQTYTVLDAINDSYRADQTLVDTAFAKHASGVYLLSLPEDQVGAPQLSQEDFLRLLTLLRGLFSIIVLTVDGMMPLPTLKAIIAQSDRSLLVTDQSIIRSRHSKYLLRALRLEDTPMTQMGLVVDNYRKRVGLEPANLAELLDLRLAGTLSCDPMARVQAMNSGETLFAVAPKDAYCTDIRRLGASLLGVELAAPPEPRERGLLGRVFG